MALLLTNIKELLQIREAGTDKVSGDEMAHLPSLKNAWLQIEDDLIAGFGPMSLLPDIENAEILDLSGKTVLPGWCDSHTHLVYAGSREQEFVDRINGLSYEEIAARGGGILNSAARVKAISEQALYEESAQRLEEVMRLGTTAIEIKSGYGLDLEGELKILRVIKRLREKYPIAIKATFLGAHAFPQEYKNNPSEYVDLIINEILPEVCKENLADFIDVFCETGYFSVQQTQRILEAGQQYGLPAKIHVNQFTAIGGVAAAVNHNALSVDHLELLTDEDVYALQNSSTMPVALPSCSFFIGIPYTPARMLLDAGLPLALASDYNPGTTPSGNMNFVVALGCIQMKLTPEEAINAATLNAAYAMGISETHGSITIGKKANLIITKPISSYYQIPYSFGSTLIDSVLIEGRIIA